MGKKGKLIVNKPHPACGVNIEDDKPAAPVANVAYVPAPAWLGSASDEGASAQQIHALEAQRADERREAFEREQAAALAAGAPAFVPAPILEPETNEAPIANKQPGETAADFRRRQRRESRARRWPWGTPRAA